MDLLKPCTTPCILGMLEDFTASLNRSLGDVERTGSSMTSTWCFEEDGDNALAVLALQEWLELRFFFSLRIREETGGWSSGPYWGEVINSGGRKSCNAGDLAICSSFVKVRPRRTTIQSSDEREPDKIDRFTLEHCWALFLSSLDRVRDRG